MQQAVNLWDSLNSGGMTVDSRPGISGPAPAAHLSTQVGTPDTNTYQQTQQQQYQTQQNAYVQQQQRAAAQAAAQEEARKAQQVSLINQMFDSRSRMYQDDLRAIDPQEQAGVARVQNQFQTQRNVLDTDFRKGQRNLTTSENSVKEDRERSLKSLRDQLLMKSQNYQNVLGSYGAGDSSAANDVNRILSGKSSENRGMVMGGASKQLNEIETQRVDLQDDYKSNQSTLDNWKQTSLSDLYEKFAAQRAQVRHAMLTADSERAKALMAYDADLAQQAISSLSAIESNYRSATDQLVGRYRNILAPQDAKIAAHLQQYKVSPLEEGTLENLEMPVQSNGDQTIAAILRKRDEEQAQAII